MADDTTKPRLKHYAAPIRARMQSAGGLGYDLAVSIPGKREAVFADEAFAGSGRQIGPASRFPIACLMKVLVSIRCLQLVDAVCLDLDDLLCERAPELSSGEPRRDGLRIRHLLSHRAGYVEPRNEHRWSLSWEMFQAFFRQRRQAFRPGHAFSYSQTGHCILANIIERVDGVSIFESVEDHILRPQAPSTFVPPSPRPTIKRQHDVLQLQHDSVMAFPRPEVVLAIENHGADRRSVRRSRVSLPSA